MLSAYKNISYIHYKTTISILVPVNQFLWKSEFIFPSYDNKIRYGNDFFQCITSRYHQMTEINRLINICHT